MPPNMIPLLRYEDITTLMICLTDLRHTQLYVNRAMLCMKAYHCSTNSITRAMSNNEVSDIGHRSRIERFGEIETRQTLRENKHNIR